MSADLEYYASRARRERKAEAASLNTKAASAHRLLAMKYESLVEEMGLTSATLVEVGWWCR